MKFKLIAMDLDGTLNNSQKHITEKTLSALVQAQQQGIHLALASARPSPGLFKERDILQLQQYGGILMSYNGGRIVDAATGATLFETAMDIVQTKQVLRQLEALPVTPILDDGCKARLDRIFDVIWRDNVQAREQQPDGNYLRRYPGENVPLSSQNWLYDEAYRMMMEAQ